MNLHIFAGRLGAGPEKRELSNGEHVWSFPVAVNGYSKGEKTTVWFRVSAFGERWDKVMSFLAKGAVVSIAGTPTERKWVKKDGTQGVSWETVADKISLLSSGQNSSGDDGHGGGSAADLGDSQDVPF